MSKYTTELRFICESLTGKTNSVDGNDTEKIISASSNKIFDFDFNIYDVNVTNKFKIDFLRHFYFREIGFETYGLFKNRLREMILLNQQYYSKIVLSQIKIEEPETTGTKSKTGTKEDRINGNKKTNIVTVTNGQDVNIFSDTPQGGLTGVLNDNYMTTATKNTKNNNDTVTNNEENDSANDSNYSENENGTTEIMSDLVIKYETAIKNSELIIFNDLEQLFIGMW